MGCVHLCSRMCSSLCRTETAGLYRGSVLNCLRRLKLFSAVALQEDCLAHLGTPVLSIGTFLGGNIQRGGVTELCSDVVNIGTFISKFAFPPEWRLRVLHTHLEFLEHLFLGLSSFVQIIRMDSLTLPFKFTFQKPISVALASGASQPFCFTGCVLLCGVNTLQCGPHPASCL